jgi:hypothetical protein
MGYLSVAMILPVSRRPLMLSKTKSRGWEYLDGMKVLSRPPSPRKIDVNSEPEAPILET